MKWKKKPFSDLLSGVSGHRESFRGRKVKEGTSWTAWIQEVGKFCASLLVIGAVAYFLLGARFITRSEWEVYQGKQTELYLDNVREINKQLQELNERMVRLETKLEDGSGR